MLILKFVPSFLFLLKEGRVVQKSKNWNIEKTQEKNIYFQLQKKKMRWLIEGHIQRRVVIGNNMKKETQKVLQ